MNEYIREIRGPAVKAQFSKRMVPTEESGPCVPEVPSRGRQVSLMPKRPQTSLVVTTNSRFPTKRRQVEEIKTEKGTIEKRCIEKWQTDHCYSGQKKMRYETTYRNQDDFYRQFYKYPSSANRGGSCEMNSKIFVLE